MANYSETLSFNGVTMHILSLTPVKTQRTRNKIIGSSLVRYKIIGLQDKQWELSGSGIVTGTSPTNLSTNRAAIEAMDDAASHALVDGIHNGTYFMVPGSLQFNDSGDRAGMSYSYSFKLVEE